MTVWIGSSPLAPGRVIVLPDVQNMTERDPVVLHYLFTHIINRNPDLVLFTGDMTQNNNSAEWARLAAETARLSVAGIKWLPVMGNHDSDSNRNSLVNTYLTAGPWVAGLMDANRVENSYGFVTLGGRTWLVLVAEYSPRTVVVDWLNQIATSHPSVPILFITHAYLYRDGTRYDWALKGASQTYNPHSPGLQYTPASGIHDGEELWQDFVLANSNVRLVISGHDFDNSLAGLACNLLTDARLDGTICHQIVQNYQEVYPYGCGYLREYHFDEVNQKMLCTTYSVLTRQFLPSHTFYLPMP
jgi:hypothetical protein